MAPQNSGEVQAAEGGNGRNGEKKRGSSKDMVAALDKRVAKLEKSVREVKETRGDEESHSSLVETLEGKIKEELENLLSEMYDKLDDRDNSLQAQIVAMKEEMTELKSELRIYQAAMKSGMLAEVAAPKPKIDAPRPNKFSGSRAAQDVDNFIWGLEQYFRVSGIDDDTTKVNRASIYLTNVALLCWRRMFDEEEYDTLPFKTWKDFQYEFKKHFYPKNAQQEARLKVRNLKHDGTILEYVRKFTELKLQLSSLSEDEGYFDFMNGLQKWAKMELRRMEDKDLSSALSTTEDIAEFENRKPESSKPKLKFKSSGGGDRGQGN
ncbi:hypothetical protein HRI_005048900 [Hibiscus trionum]|uniref:Retrotransposon gag domain-containing protein n=1 Tax=Hibiscus trionum TaxID=183268 RepID=A0A9W7MUI7_HIBTR|nr:hypothetical protein HRI_005048900 [Hibiscus trionum]